MVYYRFLYLLLFVSLVACQTQPKTEGFNKVQLSQIRGEIQKVVAKVRIPVADSETVAEKTKKLKQKKVKKEVLKKIVIGRVEWIETSSPKIEFRARVDTGAQSCSMHAFNIKEKTIKGEDYVEFGTLDEDGRAYTFLKKVVKTSMVKGTSGVAKKRFVVNMQLSFGKRRVSVNVNLNNRENLKHRFLVGRNLLLKNYIVDVTQSRLLGDRK